MYCSPNGEKRRVWPFTRQFRWRNYQRLPCFMLVSPLRSAARAQQILFRLFVFVLFVFYPCITITAEVVCSKTKLLS